MNIGIVRNALSRRVLICIATFVLVAGGIYGLEHTYGSRVTLLIETALVLFGLGVLTWAVPGKIRDGLVIACSLAVGMIVLESALILQSAFSKTPGQCFVTHDDGLGHGQPIVGWGPPRAGVFHPFKTDADGKLIYKTDVTIDASLSRKTISSAGPRPIAFFGDSWVFGDGVMDDGTLPQAFADLEGRKIPVLNLGFNGWSPAVNLAALQAGLYKPLLNDPRHFVLFTATFHVERTACRADYATSQAPRFVLAGGTLEHTGTCAEATGVWAPIISVVRKLVYRMRCTPIPARLTRTDVETYAKIVETFVTTAQRLYNVKTTVLFAPFQDAYIKSSGASEDEVISMLRHAGVDVLIDRLPPIADKDLYWIPRDGHPTALANKARAAEILEHLRKVDPKALEVAPNPSL